MMRTMTIPQALKAARGPLTQEQLGERAGVGQPAVSRWERGDGAPTVVQIAAIEDAAGRGRGFVLRAAGYVDEVTTVEEAIAADPNLDDLARQILLSAYRAASAEVELGG